MSLISKIRQFARKIPLLPPIYNFFHRAYIRFKFRKKDTEDIFTDIYKQNVWQGTDSVSGTGSDMTQTKIVAQELPKLFPEFHITSILDIPCGDFHWMKTVDLEKINYLGADIVEEIINSNIGQHQTQTTRFQRLDLIRDKLPKVDLIFCRDCLVHLSFKDINSALKNISASGSKYLLTTTFTNRDKNEDIITGQWRVLNLEKPPFNLPKPLKLINEHCTEDNGIYKDKSLALWKIADLKNHIT